MIRNIVFDIGNVLTDFRWKDFLRDKGFDEQMIGRIARASVESPFWQEYDRGKLDEKELMQEFVKSDPEIEGELHKAYDDIHGIVTPRDYAIPWVLELKSKGYGVYYLSNFSHKAYYECADSLAFIPYTDGGILSFQDHVVKPEPDIYMLLLNRYGLKAQECVFLDDMAVNIEAAKTLGFYGIVFQSKEQAQQELTKLGVK